AFWFGALRFPGYLNTTTARCCRSRGFQCLVPISFIVSVASSTGPDTRSAWKQAWMAVAPVISLLAPLLPSRINTEFFNFCSIIFFLGHSIFYIIWAHIKILKHQRIIKSIHSYTENIDLNWIKYITYSFIGAAIVVAAYNFLTKAEPLNIYI